MAEDDPIVREHMLDCYKLASDSYDKGNYSEALEIINNSGLDTKDYSLLLDVELKCLTKLGQGTIAKEKYAQYCGIQAFELMKERNFDDALKLIKDSGLDVNSYPDLLGRHDFCVKVVSEKGAVNECFKKANGLYKNKKFTEALEAIASSGLNLRLHIKLLRKKLNCLQALGKSKEAFDDAYFFWEEGLQMSENLAQILVDNFMSMGKHKNAVTVYEKLIEDPNTSESDRKLYHKKLSELMKLIKIKQPDEVDEDARDMEGNTNKETNKENESEKLKEVDVEVIESNQSYQTKSNEVDKDRDTKHECRKAVKEVHVKLNYIIEKEHLGGGLFKGEVNYQNLNYPKSFIEAKTAQRDCFDKLRSLGIGNEFLVNIDSLIYTDDLFDLLVGEPLNPLDHFFQAELTAFQQLSHVEGAKSRWWKQIAECYTDIFGDVAHGLIYLDSLGYACGNLKNSIFIDEKGRGKILPLMDKKTKPGDDVRQLIAKMISIITLPFDDDTIDESYDLPHDLIRFLGFATSDKLIHIPVCWLYNHPFFWSTEEHITFVMDLRLFMKEDIIDKYMLDGQLMKYGSYQISDDWSVNIVDGRFKTIFDRPKKVSDVKKYDTRSPIDMVRFMGAGYNHANDVETKTARFDIEAYFRRVFPKIYVNLYEALYGYSLLIAQNEPQKIKIVEAFKKWSSPYLSKEVKIRNVTKG